MSNHVKSLNIKKMIQAVAEFEKTWKQSQPHSPAMLRTSQETLDAIAATLPLRDEPNCALAQEGGAMLHGVRIYVNDALPPGQWEEWLNGHWQERPMGK